MENLLKTELIILKKKLKLISTFNYFIFGILRLVTYIKSLIEIFGLC